MCMNAHSKKPRKKDTFSSIEKFIFFSEIGFPFRPLFKLISLKIHGIEYGTFSDFNGHDLPPSFNYFYFPYTLIWYTTEKKKEKEKENIY